MDEKSANASMRVPKWVQRAWTAVGAGDRLPIDPDLSEADRAGPAESHEPHHHAGWPFLMAVAAGGWLGAIARYALERAVPGTETGFPITTWLINTSGAFVLGLILTLLIEHRRPTRGAPLVRAFACTGVLGAWTTVSTFAGEADVLVRSGRPLLAAGYLAATFAGGVLGTAAGIAVARRRTA